MSVCVEMELCCVAQAGLELAVLCLSLLSRWVYGHVLLSPAFTLKYFKHYIYHSVNPDLMRKFLKMANRKMSSLRDPLALCGISQCAWACALLCTGSLLPPF